MKVKEKSFQEKIMDCGSKSKKKWNTLKMS